MQLSIHFLTTSFEIRLDHDPPPHGHDGGADVRPAPPKPRKDTPPIERASYLGTTWVLGKKLGEGSFGEIYSGISVEFCLL